MKKIVAFFAVLMSLLSMTACGGSSENANVQVMSTTSTAEATLKNPIDSLSSEEKKIFDVFINADLPNHNKIRFVDLGDHCVYNADVSQPPINDEPENTENDDYVYIKLTGTESPNYKLHLRDKQYFWSDGFLNCWMSSDFDVHEFVDFIDQNEGYPNDDEMVVNINKALDYYWEQKGL